MNSAPNYSRCNLHKRVLVWQSGDLLHFMKRNPHLPDQHEKHACLGTITLQNTKDVLGVKRNDVLHSSDGATKLMLCRIPLNLFKT